MIAPASNNRCGARAFSTMRLTLGYSDPLPFDVKPSITSSETVSILGDLFPDHHVALCCQPSILEGVELAKNVEFTGPTIYRETDQYLWAFCFFESSEQDSQAHWVIGAPVFGWQGVQVHMVVAVEIVERPA